MVRFTELSAARRGARRKLAAANQGATRTSILATVVAIDPEDGSRLLVSVDPADPDLSVLAGPTKVVPGALVHVEVDSAGRPIRVLGPASTRPEGLDEDAPAPAPIVPMLGLAPRELSEAEAQAIQDTVEGLAEAQQDLEDAAGLLDAIGASDGPEGVADALTDYLSLPLDQITVVDNRGADEQVIAHLYDSIIVEGLLTASEIITGSMLADGAVTARTLNVVPEDGTGGVELLPPGLRIIPSDAEAGTAVSMRTDEESWIAFAQGGEQTFSVTPDGHLTAQQVSANESLLYRGTELEEIIPAPGRTLSRVMLSRQLLSDGPWALLCSATFDVEPGRVYRALANYSARSSQQIPGQVAIKFSGQTGFMRSWGIPTWVTPDGKGSNGTVFFDFGPNDTPVGTNGGTVTLEFYGRSARSGSQVAFNGWKSWSADATTACYMSVDDLGQGSFTGLVMDEGVQPVLGSNTAPAPPLTSPPKASNKTRSFSPTWAQSYTGSGAQYNVGGSDRLYHGQYLPANGVLRSMVGFDRAAIMSFCSGAEMVSARIYIRNVHSYANSGVRGRFGYRNNASKPATWGTGDMTLIGEADFDKGQGRWIGLNASGVLAALKSGAFAAFALNPATTAQNRYGYWTSSGVKLEITVRK